MKTTNTIIVKCYSKTKHYPESMRKALIKHFKKGIEECEGSEQERYAKIYDELKAGYNFVSDEY